MYSIEFLLMVIFCLDIGLGVVGIWKLIVGFGVVEKKMFNNWNSLINWFL